MKPAQISFLRLAPWRANRKPSLRLVPEFYPPTKIIYNNLWLRLPWAMWEERGMQQAGQGVGLEEATKKGSMLTRPPSRRLPATTLGNVGIAYFRGGVVLRTPAVQALGGAALAHTGLSFVPSSPASSSFLL